MEISDVKRRVLETIERSRRSAAARRLRIDQAGVEYERFLDQVAVPIFRQVSNVLRAQGYPFTVFTPAGSVRLMSDRSGEDFIELALDSAGDEPRVLGHARRSRGRRITESERVIGSGRPGELSEEDVLEFVTKELEPLVER